MQKNCLCVGAAGGTKCRGVCSDQRGDVGIAPYATRRDVSFICRGRSPRRPERNRNRPTDTPLAGWKGSRETLVSARFWLLFPHGKSNPPEADPTNSTASPLFVHIAHQNSKILCKFISNPYLHYLTKVILY